MAEEPPVGACYHEREIGKRDERISELEAALRDAYPFVCVSVDQWRRNNMEANLHPTHAEIADRIARLLGNERLPSQVLVK